MIQRKQSVYLLLAVIAIVCALCLPIGYFVDEATSLVFKPMGVTLLHAPSSYFVTAVCRCV